MHTENKRNTSKSIAFLVSITGVIVMAGWVFDISLFKSISPAWISMKFSTAFTFSLSGISLYFIARTEEGEIDKSYIALSILSLLIILIMGTLFFSYLLSVHTGVEELFIKDFSSNVKTIVPGRPSFPTMICFILTAAAGIVTTFNPDKLKTKLMTTGVIICAIGAIAVAGYIFNIPALYYFINGINSAMAFHTALMFVFLGVGFICL